MRHHYPQNDQVGASPFCIMTLTIVTICKMDYVAALRQPAFYGFDNYY